MRTVTILMAVVFLGSFTLVGTEFFLCKRGSKAAVILPLIVACFFIILGGYALILAGILAAIYLVMRYLAREEQAKRSELEKMNIEDLE